MSECKYKSFDDLPDVKGFDWETAKMYHEDVDMLCMLLTEYNKNINDYASQLEDYCSAFPDESTVKDFLIRIHSVKGTSAWVGAVHISDTARRIESYAKKRQFDTVQKELPSFIDEYRRLGKDLHIITGLHVEGV